jgi:2-polyprenyl-3-methyl-5-hydroxy-6-metoxy-1,4-benzoquinol methylase
LITKLCRACGLMRSDPYYDDTTLDSFYAYYYRRLYSGIECCTEEFFAQQQATGQSIFASVKAQLGAIRRVDVGCGAGGVLLPFAEAGATVEGCDHDWSYLAVGRKHGLPLVQGGIEALTTRDADLVILSHVLEHVRDPVALLMALSPLLGPGGCVAVAVPGVFLIWRDYGDLAFYLQNAHCWHYCLDTLHATMARAGFDLVSGN